MARITRRDKLIYIKAIYKFLFYLKPDEVKRVYNLVQYLLHIHRDGGKSR